LEGVRSLEDAHHRSRGTDRLSRLSAASVRINESLDVDTALRAVMDSARCLTDAPYASIITLDAYGGIHPGEHRRQQVYVAALRAGGSFDHLEEGRFTARWKTGLLATRDNRGRPVVHTSRWPVMVRDSAGMDVRDARFMVSYLREEEKATDVNVAAHLLFDVLSSRVNAAIVISNDSDLRFPIRLARQRVPVGVVNPSTNRLAGDLAGTPDDGAGGHWWYRLEANDFRSCQLAGTVGNYRRPPGW